MQGTLEDFQILKKLVSKSYYKCKSEGTDDLTCTASRDSHKQIIVLCITTSGEDIARCNLHNDRGTYTTTICISHHYWYWGIGQWNAVIIWQSLDKYSYLINEHFPNRPLLNFRFRESILIWRYQVLSSEQQLFALETYNFTVNTIRNQKSATRGTNMIITNARWNSLDILDRLKFPTVIKISSNHVIAGKLY